MHVANTPQSAFRSGSDVTPCVAAGFFTRFAAETSALRYTFDQSCAVCQGTKLVLCSEVRAHSQSLMCQSSTSVKQRLCQRNGDDRSHQWWFPEVGASGTHGCFATYLVVPGDPLGTSQKFASRARASFAKHTAPASGGRRPAALMRGKNLARAHPSDRWGTRRSNDEVRWRGGAAL